MKSFMDDPDDNDYFQIRPIFEHSNNIMASQMGTSVLWRSRNLFSQILVIFKEVIWHQM